MTNPTRGRFLWYDLMTTDPAAAREFYGSVLGWGTEVFQGSAEPYDMWTRDGQPFGGLMQMPEEAAGAPPIWFAYVGTPDVDATAARAVELGGTQYVPPTDIPEVGRFAVLADPDGAMFALFAPEMDAPPHPGAPGIGEFSWHELLAADYESAYEFYRDLFGWTVHEDMDMGEHGIYRIYGGDGPPYGGIMTRPAEMPVSGWIFYIRVEDLDAAVDRVKANGGQLMNGPMEVPDGDRIAQCIDPQGALFALHWSRSGGTE